MGLGTCLASEGRSRLNYKKIVFVNIVEAYGMCNNCKTNLMFIEKLKSDFNE